MDTVPGDNEMSNRSERGNRSVSPGNKNNSSVLKTEEGENARNNENKSNEENS